MHGARRRAEIELHPEMALKAQRFEACGPCGGVAGKFECGVCKGLGHVERDRELGTGNAEGGEEQWAADLAEFMEAWRFVQRHGLLAWMRINGEPSWEFVAGMEFIEGELARLEHLDRVEEAKAKK